MEPIRQAFAQLIAAHDGELRQQLQHAAAACAQQDFAPAHTVLVPLAAAGEAQAQFILGAFYLYAQGVAQDVHQAIAYWQQAAAQGMALAQTSLGALYAAQGRDDEARGLLAQAAAQGEGYAASALQMFGEQPSAAVQRAIRILREGDADGARRKLEALAREGDVEAIRYLAVMFQRGIGVAQDYAIAREWWGVALALQDDVAQYAMGELYFNGDGVTRDYAQARHYWEQAAAQGNSEAQRGLGVLFRDGHGVAQDYAEARRWLAQAAEQGLAVAQYEFGALHQAGFGGAVDEAAAQHWWQLAALQGHVDAQVALGSLLLQRQDFTGAREWLQQVAAQNNAHAQYLLGLSYVFADDVEAHLDDIHTLWHRAAAQGHEKAQEALRKLHGES
jgi:hypothetical protein